jgi:nitroreductase
MSWERAVKLGLFINYIVMSFLSQLDWRFATKKFDPESDLSKDQLDEILRSIRLTPTSYGLQPFHTYIVSNQSVKDEFKSAAFKQSQLSDSSHVLVFCARNDINKRIDDYINLSVKETGASKLKAQAYKLVMKTGLAKLGKEGRKTWASNQVYIALGFAMAACAELQIDSCPLEGFSKSKFDKILDLPDHLNSVVALAVGKRSEDPERKKVRFSHEDLFTNLIK